MNFLDRYKEARIQEMMQKGASRFEAERLMNQMEKVSDLAYKKISANPLSNKTNLDEQVREFSNAYYENIVNKPTKEFAPAEFDRDKVDKIIVESNDKMSEIIQWVEDNKEWFADEEISELECPFNKGYIEFQGELIGLGFTTDNKTEVEKFYVYMENHYVCKFEIRPEQRRRKDVDIPIVFPVGLPKERRKNLINVMEVDDTIDKLIRKYRALMLYSTLHKETVVIDEPRRKSSSTKITRQLDGNKVLPLTPKRYVITHIDKGVPGHHAAPDYQVEVRPTVRHLRSGKLVQVKGFTKYKDKPKKESKPKTYKA